MSLDEFLNNPGSTTKVFQNLATSSQIEVLWNGFINDSLFQRIVLIKLDNIPVMIAISEADIFSPLFLDILKNSGTVPIGVRLFDSSAKISRSKMSFEEIHIDDIVNHIVQHELKQRVDENIFIERNSNFNYDTQKMQLKEYILPGLVNLLDKALHLNE